MLLYNSQRTTMIETLYTTAVPEPQTSKRLIIEIFPDILV
jgi:hypothetical protein